MVAEWQGNDVKEILRVRRIQTQETLGHLDGSVNIEWSPAEQLSVQEITDRMSHRKWWETKLTTSPTWLLISFPQIPVLSEILSTIPVEGIVIG